MALVRLPFIQDYFSDGKRHVYFRRAGRRVKITKPDGAQDLPESPTFPASYDRARQAWEAGGATAPAAPSRAADGTMAALIHTYRAAPDYRQLAEKTRRDYARVLDMLETRFGPALVVDANRAWVLRLRDEAQATPRSANMRVAIISKLMGFAVERELRPNNPAARLKPLRGGESHRIWSWAECAAMTGTAAGDVALPVLIGLCTSHRQEDVLRMLWSAWDGQALRVRQGKARHLAGDAVTLVSPAMDPLRERLAATPRTHAVICVTANGNPWKPDYFRHRFAEVRDSLGLPRDLHFHGLRHTCLTAHAEDGATEDQLMAIGGHRTRSMVGRYVKQASQKRMAETAVGRLGKRAAQ